MHVRKDTIISKWEWLPVAATLLLAAFWLLSGDDSTSGRLALFICLGLAPGSVVRLSGRSGWSIHRIGIAAALIAFMLNNPRLRPDAAALARITEHWRLVALGVLIAFLQPVFGAFRLRRLLTDSGGVISFFQTLKLCLAGSFFNIFLPGATGGDVYRVYTIASGEKKRLGAAVASVSLDRLLGLPPMVFIIIVAEALDYRFAFGNERLAKLSTFIAIAAVACLGLMIFLWRSSRQYRRNGTGHRPTGRFARIRNLMAAHLSRPSTLPATLAQGLFSHIAVIAACALFACALGVEGIPPLRFFLLVPLVMAVNSIPGAPGGLGQGEIAMATILDLAAPGFNNAPAGVVVMLLLRLANIGIGLAGGMAYATGKVGFRDIESEMATMRIEAD